MAKSFSNIEMKGDRLFIGDICYALDETIYYDIWGKHLEWEDGVIRKDGEACSIVVSTKHGDGEYCDEDDNIFPVDAGNIGVTSSLYWDEKKSSPSGGKIIDVPSKVALVSVGYDDGYISIKVKDKDSRETLYQGTVDTDWY